MSEKKQKTHWFIYHPTGNVVYDSYPDFSACEADYDSNNLKTKGWLIKNSGEYSAQNNAPISHEKYQELIVKMKDIIEK